MTITTNSSIEVLHVICASGETFVCVCVVERGEETKLIRVFAHEQATYVWGEEGGVDAPSKRTVNDPVLGCSSTLCCP